MTNHIYLEEQKVVTHNLVTSPKVQQLIGVGWNGGLGEMSKYNILYVMVWVMVFSREQLFANSSLYENVIIIQTFFSIRYRYMFLYLVLLCIGHVFLKIANNIPKSQGHFVRKIVKIMLAVEAEKCSSRSSKLSVNFTMFSSFY